MMYIVCFLFGLLHRWLVRMKDEVDIPSLSPRDRSIRIEGWVSQDGDPRWLERVRRTEGQIGAGARFHKYLCSEVESVVGGIAGGTTRCHRGESGVRVFEERDLGGMTGGVAMSGEIVRPGGTSGTLNQGEAVDGDLIYRVLQ